MIIRLMMYLIFWALPSSLLGFGLPLPTPSESIAALVQTADSDFDYEAIVRLSNCSGSLVRFDDATLDDKAMILTNGHCVSMLGANEVIVNRDSRRTFRLLNSSGRSIGRLQASKLLYATMSRTDMALYQLKRSYADILEDFDTEALILTREYPALNTDIEIISGYWRRGYRCQVEAIVHKLKESRWTMFDSIRYSRPGCEVIGGTSGSPVIMSGTRLVVGVNNTGNESGLACKMNNPCEVDKDGNIFYKKGYSYGQQISWVYSCRDDSRRLDLNTDGCLLPKPVSP